jgi:hypothetical protein
VLKHCAANRKRRLSALPNVGPYIYDVKISGLTLCRSYLNPYCLGRKTEFFFSGHLNLHEKPEIEIPYRKKIITIKLKKTE